MDQKYTVDEVSSKLKVSKKTILREIKRGKLTTEKVGRRHIISENDLNAYLSAGKNAERAVPPILQSNQLTQKQMRKPLIENLPPEHVFQDEDSDNCGPSCLEMVYRKKGLDISLVQILQELNLEAKGSVTFPPQLARNLLAHGLRTNLVVANSQFISPAWKNFGRRELMDNLKNWLTFQPTHEWHVYGLHSLFYLEEGGDIELKSFESDYLKKLIDRGSILVLCVDEVWLWGHRFKEHVSEIDDLRSKSWGHFVVVSEYNNDNFTILDPYPTGLPGKEGVYEVSGVDLVNATLTWSATILEVLD